MSNLAIYSETALDSKFSLIDNAVQGDSNMKMARNRVLVADFQRESFSQINLGQSNVTFRVKKGMLVQDMMLKMKLKNIAGAAPALTALGLEEGWGYRLIRAYRWKINNSARYTVDGRVNQLQTMRELTTDQSRKRAMTLGGKSAKECGAVTGTPAPGTVSSILQGSQHPADGDGYVYINITAPFSGMDTGMKVPLDTMMFSDDIEIEIDFATNTDVFNNYAAFTTAGGVLPVQLDSVELVTRTYSYVNPSESLSTVSNLGNPVNYAFLRHTFHCSPIVSLSVSGPSPCPSGQFSFSGFGSGVTVGLTLALYNNDTNFATGPAAHFTYTAFTDLAVNISGQRIIVYNNDESRLRALQESPIEYDFPVTNNSVSTQSKYLDIPFAQHMKPSVLGHNYLVRGGVDLSSRQVNIDLTVADSGNYILYVIQHIQALAETASKNTNILFQ